MRFLFRLGQQREPGQSLYEAFEALLGDLGIQILFGSEEDASQEVKNGNKVERETTVAEQPGAVPRRSRRASFSSFYDAADESTRAIRHRRGSEEPSSRRQKKRPATRATTRSTENVRPAKASPASSRLTSKEFADNLVHYKRRRASTSSYGSHHRQQHRSNKPVQRQPAVYETISVLRPEDGSDIVSDEESDETVSSLKSRMTEQLRLARPNEHVDQFSETQILREIDTFQQYRTHTAAKYAIKRWCSLAAEARNHHNQIRRTAEAHDAGILVRQAFDQWRVLFLARKQIIETERFFSHLGRRASKARDLYLLTKAFTHWAQCASEEAERTSVARRHIIRTRYFNAWLEITAVNNFKVRRQGISKFFWIWRSSFRAKLTDDSKAVTLYYSNLVKTVYWRWFWNFCERRAPEWRSTRLKKRFFARLLIANHTNATKEIHFTCSRDNSIKRRYFTLWIEKVRKVKFDREQAEVIYQRGLTKRYIKAWTLQLKFLPFSHHVAGMVNWRIVSSSFSALVRRSRLEQRAKQLDKWRITRNSWTQWNDCLRGQTLSRQIDDRVATEALYKWVLMERFVLLRRLHEERSKRRALKTIANQWHERTHRYEHLLLDLSHKRIQALLSFVTRKWHKELLVQKQNKQIAFEFHAPRVAQETLQLWNVNYKHCQQLKSWAKDAFFYFRVSRIIKLWQNAVLESQKLKRRNAYATVRRRLKMNLARRLIDQWLQKTQHISNLRQTAQEIDQQRRLHFGSAMFDRWKDRFRFTMSENIDAGQNFNADLAHQQLQIWLERLQVQQEADTKASDFVTSHVQKIAYEGLRALRLKVLEYRSHTQTATDLRASNERRHHRSFLRIWREQTNHKRGNPSIDFTRSYKSRRLGTRPVASVVEPTSRADDRTAFDDEFEIGDWIPSMEAPSNMTPLPGYLSTPSKRAARARALVHGDPSTPATPRTPLLRRLHTQPVTVSRLGRSTGGPRFAGFEDIAEERSRTPSTR